MRPETMCIQAGYEPKNGSPRALPIYQSTTFTFDSTEHVGALFDLTAGDAFYTRLGNPTTDCVEKKIAALERQLEHIDEEMAACADDYQRLSELLAQKEQAEEQLLILYENEE